MYTLISLLPRSITLPEWRRSEFSDQVINPFQCYHESGSLWPDSNSSNNMLELGSHASLRNATDEINMLLVGMLHDGDTSI